MSPELLCGGQLHRPADVWAFGVLLLEMYTGRTAWLGMPYRQVWQAIAEEHRSPKWPAHAAPQLAASSPALASITHRPCSHSRTTLGFDDKLLGTLREV